MADTAKWELEKRVAAMEAEMNKMKIEIIRLRGRVKEGFSIVPEKSKPGRKPKTAIQDPPESDQPIA